MTLDELARAEAVLPPGKVREIFITIRPEFLEPQFTTAAAKLFSETEEALKDLPTPAAMPDEAHRKMEAMLADLRAKIGPGFLIKTDVEIEQERRAAADAKSAARLAEIASKQAAIVRAKKAASRSWLSTFLRAWW